MIKQYAMIALLMAATAMVVIAIDELFESHPERKDEHPFADDVNPPSLFSDDAPTRGSSDETSRELSPEDLKRLKKAAEMMGVIK